MISNFKEFIEYVLSFYGEGGLYPENNRTREQVSYATLRYLDLCASDDNIMTWGDGDSIDRERVRDIMTAIYGTHEIMQPISEEVYSYVRELAHV